MCGIFGFCGNPKVMDKGMIKAAVAKFKILGLYNVERGKHSCGVLMGGELVKGVNDNKLFGDFIKSYMLPDVTTENLVMIGHTRQATHGVHSEENAHPHMVNDDYVQAHNGVIRNIWQLCTKHGVNHSQIHVDSIGLAHIIEKDGFEVLSEYEGFAALLMTWTSEPNVLYMYRGVSKVTSEGEEQEERPLFYMTTEEGIYISSLESSLLAIMDADSDKIERVDANTVIKVENGEIVGQVYVANREKVNIGTSTVTHGGSASKNYPKSGAWVYSPTTNTTTGTGIPDAANPPNVMNTFYRKYVPMIWHETWPDHIDAEDFEGKVIFWNQGRYWIAEGDSKGTDVRIAHGKYCISKKGKIIALIANMEQAQAAFTYWFYEGVLLKNEKCFKDCETDNDLRNVYFNFALTISKYSEYPVCNMKSDITSKCRNISDYFLYRWYKNGSQLRSESLTPKWSNRNYIIKDGLLVSITMQHGAKKENVINVESLHKERGTEQTKFNFEDNDDEDVIDQSSNLAVIRRMEQMYFENKARQSGVEVKGTVEHDYDINLFHRVFISVDQAMVLLGAIEKNAIRYYIADVMTNEMSTDVDNIHDSRVDVQMKMFISTCIEKSTTLRDEWDDVGYKDIIDYLHFAEKHLDGKRYEEPAGDCCSLPIIPKPADPKDDVEPPFIDTLPSKEVMEQAKVPEGDEDVKWEKVNEDQEERYAFDDSVDGLLKVRECADELQAKSSDFAQQTANVLYTIVDPALKMLVETAERYKQKDAADYAKRTMKTKAGL